MKIKILLPVKIFSALAFFLINWFILPVPAFAQTCLGPSFRSLPNISLPNRGEKIAVADFNLDGKPDIAAALGTLDANPDRVAVMFGDGIGGFGQPAFTNIGEQPSDIAVADFNLDGKPDLVTSNFDSDNVSVLINNGTGGFTVTASPPVGNQPTSVAVGDFNRDGRPDLAVLRLSGTTISVILANNAGGFNSATNFSLGASTTGGREIIADDLNRDSIVDLALTVANTGTGAFQVGVMFGNGTGGFGALTAFNVNATQPTENMAVGDINLDGRLDAVTGNGMNNNISVLPGNAAGGFDAAINIAIGSRSGAVAIVDYNNDGKPDIFVKTIGNVAVLNGNGTFTGSITSPQLVSAGGFFDLDFADFNLDGRLDHLSPVQSPGAISIRFGTCGGGTVKPKIDFDGDGKTDIAIFRPSTGEWYVLRSSDNSYFSVIFGQNGDIPSTGDFDADQKTDLAVFRPSTGQWFIFRTSDFGVTIAQFGQNGDRPAAGDYDGDGRADLAVFRPSNGLWFVLRSSDNGVSIVNWGVGTDVVVQ